MGDCLKLFKEKLKSVLDYFKEEISSVRGSRPTPLLVEDIKVDYFDQKIPVKQLASILVVPPKEIQIQVWDSNAVQAIEGAVKDKTNIQTARDGNTIHCVLPELTQERKDELVKIVEKKAENARIQSRITRDEIKKEIDAMEKSGEITEDDKFNMMDDIQKGIDEFNKSLSEEIGKKTKEIDF